jgi:hypothetical protein
MHTFLIDQGSEIALDSLNKDLEQQGSNLVGFLGAGVSRQAGLPLWKELMADMDKEAQRYSQRPPLVRMCVLRTSDLLWQAEFFRLELERRAVYEQFLRRKFAGRLERGKEMFSHLVKLGFRHFITTNYDTFLEQALRNEGHEFNEFDWTNRQECRDFFLKYLLTQTPRSVIHLHGRADQPGTVILTHRDYVARYAATSEYVDKLSVLFATLRLVFIGFSLDDPDLKFILRQVNIRFGTGDVQNYAIMGFPREMEGQAQVERERLQSQFGIESVFYDDANGHAALGDVLRAMQCTPAPAGDSSKAPIEVPMPMPEPAGEIWNSDPNKGQFSGLAERNGRRLRVHDHKDDGNGMHSFHLSVESTAGAPPLTGIVRFYLHPTFARPVVDVPVEGGKATLPVRAFGAFTVGAEREERRTVLELDLATAEQALPQEFRVV